jgi:hypothetical protein
VRRPPGEPPPREALLDFLQEGGTYDDLVVAQVDVPEAILPARRRERENLDEAE